MSVTMGCGSVRRPDEVMDGLLSHKAQGRLLGSWSDARAPFGVVALLRKCLMPGMVACLA